MGVLCLIIAVIAIAGINRRLVDVGTRVQHQGAAAGQGPEAAGAKSARKTGLRVTS